MERLTTPKTERNREMICRYEDCDVCEEYCPHLQEDNCPCLQEILEKLGSYEDKEEQGLLIELPCKVGDKLYQIKNDELYELILIGLVYDEANKEWLLELAVQIGLEWHKIIRTKERIGTTFFLTRSEAEEALAKMGGK